LEKTESTGTSFSSSSLAKATLSAIEPPFTYIKDKGG
jgi:hypothetical protein